MEIISIGQKRIFTLVMAENLLPVIYRITDESHRQVKYLNQILAALPCKKNVRAKELEDNIQTHIKKWQQKMLQLGASPKGLWNLDFDHGEGYFCWKFPETQISYEHGYQDGYSCRKLISEKRHDQNENCNSSNQPDAGRI